MIRMFVLLVTIAALLLPVHAAEWETLKNCRLVPNEYNDGDSFRVMHKEREYIFRLYFADTPESDNSFPERVAEQAAHFGITSERAIAVGVEAKLAVEQLLERPFNVVTRWQDGGGWSKMKRQYAFILIDGKDGQKMDDLSSVLIARGLARAHGSKVTPPYSTLTATQHMEKYKEIEKGAREAKKGGWDDRVKESTQPLESGREK
jgi:endonuclease YncB( thermonuclease family)